MHNGYLRYAGTEVVNASRTRAYVQALAPRVGLRERCCSCDGLHVALGEEAYSSPQQDQAPWYSPYNKATAGFYGLLPLSMLGFEDSVSQIPVVANAQEGASFGRQRHAQRVVRVSALAVAASEAAMDAGLTWLRETLNSGGCTDGDCSGATLCWYSDCPTVCDFSTSPDVLLDAVFTGGADTSVGDLTETWWLSDVPAFTSTLGGALFVDARTTIDIPLEPLVPGATYRVEYNVGAYGGGSIGVPGTSAIIPLYAPPEGSYSPDMRLAREVFEFVAADSTAYLHLEAGSGTLFIGGLRIARVEQPGVVYQRWGRRQAQQWPSEFSLRYTGPAPTPTSVYASTNLGALMTFLFPSTATAMPAMSARGQITIGGLEPGVPARLFIGGAHTYYQPGVPAVTQNSLGVTIGNSPLPSTPASWSTVEGYGLVEFTPVSESVVVNIGAPVGHTFTSATGERSVSTEVYAMRVEQVLEGPFEAEVVEASLRTLGAVSTTQGPAVISTYPERGAVLRRVEWEMVAGAPRIMGEPLPARVDPDIPARFSRDRQCVNGVPVETNYFTNPSLETNTNGWTTTGLPAGFTLSRVNVPGTGFYILRLRYTGSTPSAVSTVTITATNFSTGWAAGDVLTLSYDARGADGGVSMSSRLRWVYNGYTTGQADIPNQRLSGNWQRFSVTTSVPSYVTGAVLTIDVEREGGWANGQYVDFDAFRLAAGTSTAYLDGSSPGATWLGTPNASASQWVSPSISAVLDPDCPPPPTPPSVPAVPNLCLEMPDTWLRRYVSVESRLTQVARAAAPVIRLTTARGEVRSVRVRVFANHDQRPVEQLDPCSACGEFFISYLPSGATLVVDASQRTASISTKGAVQSADHLLYDGTGGPVVWPEMSCGVPYVIEVATGGADDFLVDIGVDIVPLY